MKIRTDFVTNSSSSSFTVTVTVKAKNKTVSFSTPTDRYGENEDGFFAGDLRDINAHLNSVQELATWLADATKDNSYGNAESPSFVKKKSKFVESACEKIGSVKDIYEITVTRKYSAWGEFAEFLAEGNPKLHELAEKYIKSGEGIEKERAEAELITYIYTATDIRGDSFGAKSVNGRYGWYYWSEDSLQKMAQALCDYKYQDSVRGVEQQKLDLRTGEYFNDSEFRL